MGRRTARRPAFGRPRQELWPGSVIEWDETQDGIIVRHAGSHSFGEMRAALFPKGPARSLEELKAGLRSRIRWRHARR